MNFNDDNQNNKNEDNKNQQKFLSDKILNFVLGLFTVFVIIFGLFWMINALRMGAPIFVAMIGLIFGLFAEIGFIIGIKTFKKQRNNINEQFGNVFSLNLQPLQQKEEVKCKYCGSVGVLKDGNCKNCGAPLSK